MFTFRFQAFTVFVTCNTYKAVNAGKAWGVVCNWALPPALFFGVCVCVWSFPGPQYNFPFHLHTVFPQNAPYFTLRSSASLVPGFPHSSFWSLAVSSVRLYVSVSANWKRWSWTRSESSYKTWTLDWTIHGLVGWTMTEMDYMEWSELYGVEWTIWSGLYGVDYMDWLD